MGVRRAVDMALTALETYPQKKVMTLGPLIHNRTALEGLALKGLSVLEEKDVENAEGESVVIIRAHGVPPTVRELLEHKNCTIIDATCPRVTASQSAVAEYAQNGWTVILAGDRNHGEVTGIAGYAGKHFILVQNREEAAALAAGRPEEKAVLLSQTTFSSAEFEAIALAVRRKYCTVRVMNTICPATRERQAALEKLCPAVDGILVIGGKNSANTKRLLLTAQRLCTRSELIETAADIPPDFYTLRTIGLTAGASTPDSVITEVEQTLQCGKK